MLVRFEFILLSAIPQLSIVNGMNSEWIGKIALTILSVICLYLMALGLKLVGSKISIHLTLFMFFFQSLILFFKELTELAQLLFSLQILPLTMWALEILAPVVNHKDYFFYVLTSSIILFLLYSSFLIYHYLKVKDENFVNPAEKRKSIAKSRKLRRWFYSFVSIQIVFFTFLANVKIIQEKEVMTNPPMEVTAQYGHIHITHEMLHEEKGLNIFSYIFPDQTQARFMVVGKTDENYGVALDACAICGVAGYFQKGNQIICKKCNSVVNVNTIGFTGGCNPIPMTYENQSNGQLDIPVSELEKSKSLFQ
ncbi:putative membrane protein [Neobacillus niacini]|nr:putative membrane protein [Neobacillus niacini]